jgi:hypothetical protein
MKVVLLARRGRKCFLRTRSSVQGSGGSGCKEVKDTERLVRIFERAHHNESSLSRTLPLLHVIWPLLNSFVGPSADVSVAALLGASSGCCCMLSRRKRLKFPAGGLEVHLGSLLCTRARLTTATSFFPRRHWSSSDRQARTRASTAAP